MEQVFYLGYDERAWTRQQIMDAVARRLLTPVEYVGAFQPLSLDAQQAMLAGKLRAARHLLILDNLESITGAQLAIQNTLPPEEQRALRGLLADLERGKTLVLLGSRGAEEWLTSDLPSPTPTNLPSPAAAGEGPGVRVVRAALHDLPGLDPEAASTLADRILERQGAAKYRADPQFRQLLKLLDGYPLALEVVLANLARQTPAEVLAALQAGDEAIDMRSAKKTESILRCIDYSHSNLSPEAQGLLACLAPFTSVINTGALEHYTEQLQQQPALAQLPFERWQEVLREAANWGLVSPHPDVSGYLRLQPIFPYFLRSRLNTEGQAEVQRAVEKAFREHYDGLGGTIAGLLLSKGAKEKQLGQALAGLEYENLATALDLALEAQVSIVNLYLTLSHYIDTTQDQRRGLELGEAVLARLEKYPADQLAGPLGAGLLGVLDNIGKRELLLKQYTAAETSYQEALRILSQQSAVDTEMREKSKAVILRQLGRVAQHQRQWAQAEQYHQQALQIYVEYNDRYRQASTYYQLGRVAQEQRQWAQAEQHYQQALQIYVEYNDRHSQASTYHQLGRVAQHHRQWAQAEQHYQQALQIFTEYNDRHSQASTYHNLGIVAQHHGQWAQAEQHYQQALQIYVEYSDRHSQASTYHQLGVVAQEQRQWAQAEQYYQQALQIKIEYNDRFSQAGAYHQLGSVAQEQRQWAQAREYFLRALETYVAYQDTHNGGIVLRSLARLWRSSDDAHLPAAVAAVLGVTPAEVEERMRGMGEGDTPGG